MSTSTLPCAHPPWAGWEIAPYVLTSHSSRHPNAGVAGLIPGSGPRRCLRIWLVKWAGSAACDSSCPPCAPASSPLAPLRPPPRVSPHEKGVRFRGSHFTGRSPKMLGFYWAKPPKASVFTGRSPILSGLRAGMILVPGISPRAGPPARPSKARRRVLRAQDS